VWSTVRRQSALSWRYAWQHCSMSLLVRGSRCRSNTICGSYAINGGRRFSASRRRNRMKGWPGLTRQTHQSLHTHRHQSVLAAHRRRDDMFSVISVPCVGRCPFRPCRRGCLESKRPPWREGDLSNAGRAGRRYNPGCCEQDDESRFRCRVREPVGARLSRIERAGKVRYGEANGLPRTSE